MTWPTFTKFYGHAVCLFGQLGSFLHPLTHKVRVSFRKRFDWGGVERAIANLIVMDSEIERAMNSTMLLCLHTNELRGSGTALSVITSGGFSRQILLACTCILGGLGTCSPRNFFT